MTKTSITIAEFKALKPAKKKSKYNAVKTQVSGISFSSKNEAKRYADLLLLEQAGLVRSLQLQVPFDLVVQGELVCRYFADFQYEQKRGRRWDLIVEDVKGARTGAAYQMFKLKKKLMWACLNIDVLES